MASSQPHDHAAYGTPDVTPAATRVGTHALFVHTQSGIPCMPRADLRPLTWLGDSRDVVRAFPRDVRDRIGAELYRLQIGLEPRDWKPMAAVGPGAREIRVRSGVQFRVIYAWFGGTGIVIAHAFRKTTARTSKPDIDTARRTLRAFADSGPTRSGN